ncbi:glycine receptor subunit alpha-2-like [Parasteatoda tepidariorum]|uniref:glycine receptor subunit alpha-2-like n=1 Tax=Parasteatoda tepidariorum TaxID=114398 RepID=UPI001C7285A9|nr:glycine receptor subunit alpha-2-like [Parasteatoda tepidariorum]
MSNSYGIFSRCEEIQEEKRIEQEDIAPPHYDRLTPPKINGSHVIVNISISKLNVRSIDESDMSFSVVIEMWQTWKDFRLNYPSWSKKRSQVLDSDWMKVLWNPNIYFINSVDGKMDNIISPSSFFWVSKSKTVFYCCRLLLKLICEMDLVRFPHDEQKCSMKLASAFFSEKDLVLQWKYTGNKTDKFSSLQQFDITNVENSRCLMQRGSRNVSCLEETIVLLRRGGYFLINVYIPTILIVFMSMLTFWIPLDAVPARVTLGVTSLLTIITKQYQASLPNVSYIVALNVWLSCCIAFVFFSLLEFATVIALNSKSKKPSSTFRDDSEMILPMVILKANGTWSTKQCWNALLEKKFKISAYHLDYFSRIIFPLCFFIFCIVYWHYYNSF